MYTKCVDIIKIPFTGVIPPFISTDVCSPQTSRAPRRFEGTACALALGVILSIFPPSRNQALRHVVCVLPVPFDFFVTLNPQFPPTDTNPSSVTYAEMVLITYQLSLILLRSFFHLRNRFPSFRRAGGASPRVPVSRRHACAMKAEQGFPDEAPPEAPPPAPKPDSQRYGC